jgi:hypothetical protein
MKHRRYSCNYPSLYASDLSILFKAPTGHYQLCGFPVKLLREFELLEADHEDAELWFAKAETTLNLIKRQTGCCQRCYLCCPKCHLPKTKLFWIDNQLSCQSCGWLSYGSQSEGQLDLLMRRVRRLRRAIWCASEVDVDNLLLNARYFNKPARMHSSTYSRKLAALLKAERQLWMMQGAMIGIKVSNGSGKAGG